MAVPQWLGDDPRVRHVHHRPATAGVTAELPPWVSPAVRDCLAGIGITALWQHQATAAQALFDGRHVAIATPTASGKSLAYLLPVIAGTAEGSFGRPIATPRLSTPARAHTALYLAPTKALAHDQLRAALRLGLPGWRLTTLDGDSDDNERRFAREFAGYVLTNPDMLHRSVLPNHGRWSALLRGLRYVVVDEAHRYRGVFGAHVAAVLRRLRRLCRHYGSDPVFVTASATVANPGELLTGLTGVEGPVVVTEDCSPRPDLDFVLWQPTGDPHREAAELLARLVDEGRQTLAFTTSRVQAELVAERTRGAVREPEGIAAYRSGYLPADRRELEGALHSGRLRGVACTSALELGVDIAGMDAVISCGFPGTLASLWQQAGRAGRAGRSALAVLVARADPLDAYLCDHPELVFDAPVEATVVHPANPQVLSAHLAAAAQELPLTAADAEFFGPPQAALLAALTAAGVLRRRADAWYWTHPQRAVDGIDLRAAAAGAVEIVEAGTGRVIGQLDAAAADRTVHEGAVYLHQGEQWLVDSFDEPSRSALCHRVRAGYFTQAQSVGDVRILAIDRTRALGRGTIHAGDVELSTQVRGYLRRDELTGRVWDSTPLTLPVRTLRTRAVWFTLPDAAWREAGLSADVLAGAAHAAEHTAIGLLPVFAPCDRWDIGGLSTLRHPDTGLLTVFVHDGLPGGAGFADRGYDAAEAWLAATGTRLASCPCSEGCPRCVVSPKCGSGNQPLDKAAARVLMELLIAHDRLRAPA